MVISLSKKKDLQEQLEAIQGQLTSLAEKLKASERKELFSVHEQVFLLLYGVIIGLVAGVYGNLWATLFYEHIIKGDTSLTTQFWVSSLFLIAVIFILGIMMFHSYSKMKETASGK